jgi:hypothetical protein
VRSARQIMQLLIERPVLIDEFFFQIIKQTINNRTPSFLFKTWELLLIVASTFLVWRTPCKA